MSIKILYFASLRERLKLSEEALPADAGTTVAELLQTLKARGPEWENALSGTRVKVAVNQEVANLHTPLGDGDEVAFFPPVTGG